MRAGVVQDLVERDARKIGELHFHNWPHSLQRRADRGPDHRILADGRVQHASWKFFSETFCCFERATEFSSNVLSVNENAFFLGHYFCLRLANRFEISDAHRWSPL